MPKTGPLAHNYIRIQSESHGYHKDDTQKDKGTNNTYFNKPNFPFFCTNYSMILFPYGKFWGDDPMDHPPGQNVGVYISPIPRDLRPWCRINCHLPSPLSFLHVCVGCTLEHPSACNIQTK